MKKVVIAASSSLQSEITFWKNKFDGYGYEVIAYPEKISGDIIKEYPNVFIDFFRSIEACDVFFVLNEDRKGKIGYIGAETFAELCYAITQNLLYKKNIGIFLLKMPGKDVQCFDEIDIWIKNDMIKMIDI